MMNDLQKEIILAMAENDMNVTNTANEIHLHRNTVEYHLKQIYKKTKLNPKKFYDLCKLLEVAKGCYMI